MEQSLSHIVQESCAEEVHGEMQSRPPTVRIQTLERKLGLTREGMTQRGVAFRKDGSGQKKRENCLCMGPSVISHHVKSPSLLGIQHSEEVSIFSVMFP